MLLVPEQSKSPVLPPAVSYCSPIRQLVYPGTHSVTHRRVIAGAPLTKTPAQWRVHSPSFDLSLRFHRELSRALDHDVGLRMPSFQGPQRHQKRPTGHHEPSTSIQAPDRGSSELRRMYVCRSSSHSAAYQWAPALAALTVAVMFEQKGGGWTAAQLRHAGLEVE